MPVFNFVEHPEEATQYSNISDCTSESDISHQAYSRFISVSPNRILYRLKDIKIILKLTQLVIITLRV